MHNRQNNKRPVETFLVQGRGVDFFNTANATQNINNSDFDGDGLGDFDPALPSDAVTLLDKQIGAFDASGFGNVAPGTAPGGPLTTPPAVTAGMNPINTALTAGDGIQQSPVIYLAQGNENSMTPSMQRYYYPLWNRPYERSADIIGRNWIVATKQKYQIPGHSTWVIGQPAGSPGEIFALDLTEFQMNIAYRGRIVDEFYSGEAAAHFSPHYVTPNYSFLQSQGVAYATDSRDHLIQNLAWNINRNSRILNINRTRFNGNDPLIGLAIDSTGAAGTPIASLVPGMFLPIVNTQFGIRGIVLTLSMVKSIQCAALRSAVPIDGASILTIDLTTAGTTTAGVADMMMLVALDRWLAYEDRIPQVKIRLDVGLNAGFDFTSVYHEQLEQPFEGQGIARMLEQQFRNTQQQRKYNLDHTLDPVIEFPSPIDLNETYNTYVIEAVETNQIDTTNLSESPQKTILLFPTDVAFDGATCVTTVTPEQSEHDFRDLFDKWLGSADNVLIEGIVE